MSTRRAWCQSRLNSSCSRASSSVRLNISLRRWTPRTVCTARLGRPLSTQYMGAKRSSSIRGSASFRKTSAQLLSRRLAFFGVTRNWDCQRLSCGSRIRNILPSLGQAQRPRPFITLSPPCPRLARGFYEQIMVPRVPGSLEDRFLAEPALPDGPPSQPGGDPGYRRDGPGCTGPLDRDLGWGDIHRGRRRNSGGRGSSALRQSSVQPTSGPDCSGSS